MAKYTNEQIEVGLRCLNSECVLCKDCAFYQEPYPRCREFVAENALDLIKRQEAEIERLMKRNEMLSNTRDSVLITHARELRRAKSEAIKEFAERLKARATTIFWRVNEDTREITHPFVDVNEIDNLVKEMAGDD